MPVTATYRFLVLAVVLAAVLAAGLHRSGIRLLASADSMADGIGPYLQRADGSPADPVNVIFTGVDSSAAVAARVSAVMRWSPLTGGEMAFEDHGKTRWTEVQVGVNIGNGYRHHMRLAAASEPSAQWGSYVLAGVHEDVPVGCGHAGRAFNERRDDLARAMRDAGYSVTHIWLGNDGPVEHCDGSVTNGDGWAVVISLQRPTDLTPTPTATPTPTGTPRVTVPAVTPAAPPEPTATPVPMPPTATPTKTPTPTPVPPVWHDVPSS